jgi:uncharacterized delta-60 repeat protein
MALQSDGKILVAGDTYNGADYDFALVRYNADGSLDTSFDGDGKVTTDIAGENDIGYGVAVQPDGKIVVVGSSGSAGYYIFALVRYNADGSLDTTFDGDGKVTTAVGGISDGGFAVAMQPDGKIVAAGHSYNGENEDFAVVRYNSDGSPDTSFDVDGKVTTDFRNDIDIGRAVVVQPDGGILVAGSAMTNINNDFAVVRYNSDGSLDRNFDGDGKVTTAVGSGDDYANAIALQLDGKVVVAGDAMMSNKDLGVVRYNSDGSLDTSFDGDGKVTTGVGSLADQGAAVAIQADGKIVVAGVAAMSNNDLAVVRYNSDGSLDTSLDGDGKVTTAIGGGSDFGSAVAIQADGKIVAAGLAEMSNSDFAVVRYNSDGSLDDSCTIDPLLKTFYWYDDASPLPYMSYQTGPGGAAISASDTTVNFYSDVWPAGWGVSASVMNYLGFWADANNRTFTVNVYGGTTLIGTLTQTADTTGIEGQAFFVTTTDYTFAAGERLRVEFIVPQNMTLYWDGPYWESRFQFYNPIIVP